MLGVLRKAGRVPSDERISVFVSAMRHSEGVTDTKRVNWYGNASYNYNTDAIDYKACNRKGWISSC